MPLLVVGSVAIDSVETPAERRDNVLGGSAIYFSFAASFFTGVRLVGVVGEDWPAQHTAVAQGRGIDTSGLQIVPGGKTFRWTGRYEPNMNDRETLDVQLNVFGEFDPDAARDLPPARSTCSSPTASPARADRKCWTKCPAAAGRGRHDGPLDQHRARPSSTRC